MKHCRPEGCYKFVFCPDDPTLCYIGMTRPVVCGPSLLLPPPSSNSSLPQVGSVPALAELQARWVSSVYAKRYSLPSTEEMKESIEKDTARNQRLYPADHARLPTLVNHWEYADQIAKYFGAKPRHRSLYITSPIRLVNYDASQHLFDSSIYVDGGQ